MVETAITLIAFLTLVLGTLDLGIGVLRHHMLAHATRHLARQAAVHGNLATELGTWGPGAYSGTAAGSGPIPATVAPLIYGVDPADVSIQVTWIDGGNDQRDDDRVRVVLSAPYRPIITFIFGNPTFTLSATSVTAIAH
jgi:hypothetical protein